MTKTPFFVIFVFVKLEERRKWAKIYLAFNFLCVCRYYQTTKKKQNTDKKKKKNKENIIIIPICVPLIIFFFSFFVSPIIIIQIQQIVYQLYDITLLINEKTGGIVSSYGCT